MPKKSEAGGIAFDKSGNLYTANVTGTVSMIDPAGEVSTFATLPSGSKPNDLVFNSAGDLFVTLEDGGYNAIDEITPSGTVSPFITLTSKASTNGLAIDSAGNIYDANASNGAINLITPNGVLTTFAKLPKEQPVGEAFDANGNLFVAELNGIAEINKLGAVTTFADDSNIPNFLAFGPTPVPEPSTWAILLSGAGLLGVMFRRRAARV